MQANSKIIYLDHNATTPMAPEVFAEIEPFLREHFGNPSSLHSIGRRAKDALMDARERIADRLGASSREIVFTAGGTEANNLAILGVIDPAAGKSRRKHLVISCVEHHAVLHPVRELSKRGFEVTQLNVDLEGRLNLETADNAIDDKTLLVSVMMANNETGVIHPVREIAAIAHRHGALMHTDAVQACGKIPIDVRALDVDLLSLSAHKLYGPKGVGALYVRKGTRFHATIRGGNQERKRRPGTENVAGAVGLARAMDLVYERLHVQATRLESLRNSMEERVLSRVSGATINARAASRTVNTSSMRFENVDGEALVGRLDQIGIAVSTGAACAAGSIEPSHVLVGMGLSPEQVQGSIRVSLGHETMGPDIDLFIDGLIDSVGRLRQERECAPSSSGVSRLSAGSSEAP